jgi:ribulose-phosphate 3-epimerase
MTEILPAILAHDETEFRAKVEKVRALGLTLHVDVMDGKFVPQTTWAPPEKMRELLGSLPFEAHLMVSDPDKVAPLWFDGGAMRVIFHAESLHDCDAICREAETRGGELALALNPETPVSSISPVLSRLRRVMIMGVRPGRSGQPFQETAIDKIREIKRLRSDMLITVDGGVKPQNARQVADAGADAIVSGSGITDRPDPTTALEDFRRSLDG